MASVYGVFYGNNLTQIYDREEDANIMKDFLIKKHKEQFKPSNIILTSPKNKDIYTVREVYKNCYINKIKAGHTLRRCYMLKDGTVIKTQETNYAPNTYGFKRATILNIRHVLSSSDIETIEIAKKDPYLKCVVFSDLVANDEELIKKCNDYRLSTLLDDVWKKDYQPKETW